MSDAAEQPMLEVLGVSHRYGSTPALDGVSLVARRGEFLTILGESGSGKTTLLRIISGHEHPTHADRIAIDGRDVNGVPAARRNCTTVFQHYALFPHMSVYENIEYGLKIRGVPRAESYDRAREALSLVRLEEKHDRRINQLSGGEKQRVALARALVVRPAILLLDEPLGALDEKLRLEMQSELVDLQRRLGTTFVYITHSQEEALTMSDRVLLMRKGRIEQRGSPQDLFERPVSRFVADFMGFENILAGTVAGREGDLVVVSANGQTFRGVPAGALDPEPGNEVFVAVRAERMQLCRRDRDRIRENVLPCSADSRLYRGKYLDQRVRTDLGLVTVRIWDRSIDVEDFDAVTWNAADGVVTSA